MVFAAGYARAAPWTFLGSGQRRDSCGRRGVGPERWWLGRARRTRRRRAVHFAGGEIRHASSSSWRRNGKRGSEPRRWAARLGSHARRRRGMGGVSRDGVPGRVPRVLRERTHPSLRLSNGKIQITVF